MLSTLAKTSFTSLCLLAGTGGLSSCAAAPDAAPVESPPSRSAGELKSNAVGAPGRGLADARADCNHWATITSGRYRYENNVWGMKKATGKFEQCLLSRERNGKKEIGWTWSWPGFDPSVFAYPEVVVCWKPWSGATSDQRFPILVSAVKTMTLEYEVETEVTGSYNLAPEIWLTDTARPNPKSITTEVMFWMDYTEGARPAGSIVDHVDLNGTSYELWREDSIGVDANGKGWRLLTFKSPARKLKGQIDIAALLRHLTTANLANVSDYVASVEFGNEVMGGTGTTWLKHFDVHVAP